MQHNTEDKNSLNRSPDIHTVGISWTAKLTSLLCLSVQILVSQSNVVVKQIIYVFEVGTPHNTRKTSQYNVPLHQS